MECQSFSIQKYNACRGVYQHDYDQILIPLHSSMRLLIEEDEYIVSPRQICLVPKGKSRQCNFIGELFTINILDDGFLTNRLILRDPVIVPLHDEILRAIYLIQEELSRNPGSSSVQYLYKYIFSKITENCLPPSILYIYNHYDRPIKIETLARMESYNVTYYNDWFKRVTGTSPGAYIRKVRIERAMDLILEDCFGITTIATMVGFNSASSFTRCFHNIVGLTPSAYKRSCSSEKKPPAGGQIPLLCLDAKERDHQEDDISLVG